MAMNTEEESDQPENSKFLTFGKYFLIAGAVAAQLFLAYVIIDKNYDRIYDFVSGLAPDQTSTYQMEELIVNPAGTQGQRYLVVEIGLDLVHSDHIELIEDSKQKIKHDMNRALSSRTVDELVDADEREALRDELAGIINQAIGVHSVRNLYYTRYVMQ